MLAGMRAFDKAVSAEQIARTREAARTARAAAVNGAPHSVESDPEAAGGATPVDGALADDASAVGVPAPLRATRAAKAP
jgi:hypothetical protein